MKNLFTELPGDRTQEHFQEFLALPGATLERIVSYGQSTPEGEWYDQNWGEWVMVLQGEAVLLLEQDHKLIHMKPGDQYFLPANCRHRVEWTLEEQPTIWLALHLKAD